MSWSLTGSVASPPRPPNEERSAKRRGALTLRGPSDPLGEIEHTRVGCREGHSTAVLDLAQARLLDRLAEGLGEVRVIDVEVQARRRRREGRGELQPRPSAEGPTNAAVERRSQVFIQQRHHVPGLHDGRCASSAAHRRSRLTMRRASRPRRRAPDGRHARARFPA